MITLSWVIKLFIIFPGLLFLLFFKLPLSFSALSLNPVSHVSDRDNFLQVQPKCSGLQNIEVFKIKKNYCSYTQRAFYKAESFTKVFQSLPRYHCTPSVSTLSTSSCTLFQLCLKPIFQLCGRYNLQLAQSKYSGLHYLIEVSNCTKMLCSFIQRVFTYNSPLFSYFNFQILTQIFCIAVQHSVSV